MTDDKPLACDEKLAFTTKREAEVAAIVARHQRGIMLHAYLCRDCGLWHLSSGSSIEQD